jgi:hypothetical protein
MEIETLELISTRQPLTDEQLLELALEALALDLANPHTYACADDTDLYSRQIAESVEYYDEKIKQDYANKQLEAERCKIQYEIFTHESTIHKLRFALLGVPVNSYVIINDIKEVRNKITNLQNELRLLIKNKSMTIYFDTQRTIGSRFPTGEIELKQENEIFFINGESFTQDGLVFAFDESASHNGWWVTSPDSRGTCRVHIS